MAIEFAGEWKIEWVDAVNEQKMLAAVCYYPGGPALMDLTLYNLFLDDGFANALNTELALHKAAANGP